MDGVTLYMIIVFSAVLAIAVVILLLGLAQKDDEAGDGHDVPAE
jgi:hypothetical protein